MTHPQGFVDSNYTSHVCLLLKSSHGLHQTPSAQYQALSSFLISFGFNQSRADISFATLQQGFLHLIVLMYVDDLILTDLSSTHIYYICNLLLRFRVLVLYHISQALKLFAAMIACFYHNINTLWICCNVITLMEQSLSLSQFIEIWERYQLF